MTSVDELFKVSLALNYCTTDADEVETDIDSKRKAQNRSHTRSKYVSCAARSQQLLIATDELYKAAKLEANGDVKSKGKAPMVEDEGEDDGEAGPELPPDFEEDIPDDEEGRFFGGGMERQTAEAMHYIDQQDEAEGDVEVRGGKQLLRCIG